MLEMWKNLFIYYYVVYSNYKIGSKLIMVLANIQTLSGLQCGTT